MSHDAQDPLFPPPVQASARVPALIAEAEHLLALGRASEALDAVIRELRDLEAEHDLPKLLGTSLWLDRYDAVLLAWKELP